MISHSSNQQLSKNQRVWQQSIWYTLLSASIIMIIIVLHYNIYKSSVAEQRNSQERLNLEIGKTTIITELSNIESDVTFLARQAEQHGYLDNLDEHTLSTLAKDYHLFSDKKGVYDQIRLIDNDGQEIIRINHQNQKSNIVKPQQLQNKANRYYFKNSIQLEKDDIYISPFDLNIEHGQIQKPLNPVIRFGTPVFNSNNKKVGVLILNYRGKRLLKNFRNATTNIEKHVMLVNNQGYWLSHFNPEMEWGFMLDHKQTFATDFRAAWQKISKQDKGQFNTPNGLFTFSTIYHNIEQNQEPKKTEKTKQDLHHWSLVAHVSHSEFTNIRDQFIRDNLYFYLIFFIFFMIASYVFARLNTRHQLAQIEIEFEQYFRKVLESIELNVLAVNIKGEITFCNDALLNLLGWQREELIGKQWIETLVVNRCKKSCTELFFKETHENIQSTTHESWLQDRQGNEYLIRWHDTLLKDGEEKPIGFIFMGEDITHYRENEIRIRHLSQAVEQSPASVILTNNQGKIEYINPKFEDLTGYKLEEIKGLNPRILKSGETQPEDYAQLWSKVKQGKTWKGVFHNRKKNGELYWESASISGIRNPEGEITHFLAVKEDITEQKMLEERFKHCFNAAPVAMVMSDNKNNILLANNKLQELYGYSENDLLGQSIETVIPHKNNQRNLQVSRKSTDYLATSKKGETFPVEIGVTSTPTLEGTMQISAIIDLTSRLKLEAELMQRNEEISRNQALNTVGKMANIIAHDLRNPLSSIKMGLQILKQDANKISEEDANELNQIALEQVHYMEDILADLMSYSRPNAVDLEWIDIEKIIKTSIQLVQKEITQSQASIHTHFEKNLPIISADSRKLRQVFSNLISNAIQSVESIEDLKPIVDISIKLELGDENSYLTIEIKDNGCGFDESETQLLFEPFHTSRSKGTGLGLSIAKRFIELQNGEIFLKLNKNGGSSAIVKLNIDPAQ